MRTKYALILAVVGFVTALFTNCGRKFTVVPRTVTPQPQKVPTIPPEKIGINTVGGWSDSPFISRDGQRLYFAYSRYNFAPWLKSGGAIMPTLEGPDRPGLHKHETNPWDETDIYVATKQQDGRWSEPVALDFNGPYGDACGMEIKNGQSFIWLRGVGDGNAIVMANRNLDGSWGAVVDLGSRVNLPGTMQDNPHLTEDGKGLFFVSDRPGGIGGRDIWFSLNLTGAIDGEWTDPVPLGEIFNTSGDDDQMWVSEIDQSIYWNSGAGIKHCVSNGTTCTAAPTAINFPGCAYAAEASMPDDGKSLYFGCGDLTTGRVKIMYSLKQADGSWGQATPVD